MKRLLNVTAILMFFVVIASSCATVQVELEAGTLNRLYSQAEQEAKLRLRLPVKYIPKIFSDAKELKIRVSEDPDDHIKTIQYQHKDEFFYANDYHLEICEINYFDHDLVSEDEDDLFIQYEVKGQKFFIASEISEDLGLTIINFVYYPDKNISCFIAVTKKTSLSMTQDVAEALYNDFVCVSF